MNFIDRVIKISLNHGESDLKRINFLDGWRGLAILFVLVDHFLPSGFFGGQLGRLGVDLFFVLSGLLMSQILFVHQTDLYIFYKRRISRILPVFVLFVCVLYAASFLYNLSNEHDNFLYAIFSLRSYFPAEPHSWNTGLPMGHLWSLYVEMHCYLALGIIAAISFLKNRAFVVLFVLGFAALLFRVYYQKILDAPPPLHYIRTEVASSHLFISAGYFLIKGRFEPYVKSWMPPLALVLAIICYSKLVPTYTLSWLLSPFLLAFSLSHLNLSPKIFLSALTLKYLRMLGIWSYSIYLWQEIFYIYQGSFDAPKIIVGVVALALAILSGVISFYFIEKPIRKYINNTW